MGKSPADMKVALATDKSGKVPVVLAALQVSGADPNALLTGFIAATKNQTPTDVVSQVNVGGKNVSQIADAQAGTSIYAYGSGDILYYVQAADPQLAAAALSVMP